MTAITRSKATAARLRSLGIDGHAVDSFQESRSHISSLLENATHVLSSVPPDKFGDPVLRCFSEPLGNVKHLQWIVSFLCSSVAKIRDAQSGQAMYWVSN